MSQKKIFLDMDGVVADFMGGCIDLWRLQRTSALESFLTNSVRLEGEYFGTSEEIDRKIIGAGDDFWRRLKVLPYAHRLYADTISLVGKENVFFLTNTGKFHAGAHGKLDWLDATFGDGTSKYHIITKFKELLATPDRLLVDDLSLNIERWKANGGIGIQYPNQYLMEKTDFFWDVFKEKLHESTKS